MFAVEKPVVLVVDDDPVIRTMALASFEYNGLRVQEAEDGLDALEIIDRNRPDLILLDVMLPNMDGFTTCEQIRKLPAGTSIPVFMMTALNDVVSINRAYEAGATDFITKPVNWLTLVNRVKHALRASKTFKMFRRSEEKNRSIIQALPDLVFVLNAEGRILDLKYHESEELFVPAEAALGGTICDILPPETASTYQAYIKKAIENPELQVFEYSLPFTDGEKYFEARLTSIGVDEVLAIVRNVTKRKLRDAKLRQYQENLEELVRERTDELMDTIKRLENEISERRRVTDTLTMLEKAALTTRTGITISDTERRIVYVNPADAQMHGYTPDELIGKNVSVYAPSQLKKHMTMKEFEAAKSWVHESVNVRKDGSRFPVKLVSDIVRDETGNIVGIVTTCEDLTEAKKVDEELKRYQVHLEDLVEERTNELKEVVNRLEVEVEERKGKEKEIRHLAYHDSLTGLPNRAYLNEQLYYALKNAENNGGSGALMYIDLDNFKRINDTLGHSLGDILLKDVSRRLTGCLRKTDPVVVQHQHIMNPLVTRLGGDEFIVLLPELENPQDALKVSNRIIKELSEPFTIECHEVFVTPSIGVSYYPLHGTDADSLLMKADTAMYHAKEKGKNGCVVYSETMSETIMARLVLENDLHKAMHLNELYIDYQPLYDIGTGRIMSLEALLRWRHSKHGNISPSEFIPIAEQYGLIIPIGDWVLQRVMEQIKEWRAEGVHTVPVAVNLSINQFIQHNIVNLIGRIMDKCRLEPGCLELELTESTLMKDPAETITRLSLLKSMGVRISIDDFGTGYSSLSYLRKLPLDAIKIDRSFIHDISSSADAEAIAKAVIAMSHSMNLTVIAEGVETEQQLSFLKTHGCDMVQGFYFSRPVSAATIKDMLRQDNLKTA